MASHFSIQIGILVILIIIVFLVLLEIRAIRKIHDDTLKWRKKKKTYEIINEMRKFRPDIAREKFKAFLLKPGTTIPIEVIKRAIEEDPRVRTEIIELINLHEGIANGIENNLLDETIVKENRGRTFKRTFQEYREYIFYRRTISAPTAWIEYEELVKKWFPK